MSFLFSYSYVTLNELETEYLKHFSWWHEKIIKPLPRIVNVTINMKSAEHGISLLVLSFTILESRVLFTTFITWPNYAQQNLFRNQLLLTWRWRWRRRTRLNLRIAIHGWWWLTTCNLRITFVSFFSFTQRTD